MTPAASRQLSDLFERVAKLELAMRETELSKPDALKELSRIRIDFYRLLKEST
jgi:hypothetical protein